MKRRARIDATDTAFEIPENARVVELPVCPQCGAVGKQPGQASVSYKCKGPSGFDHKATRMHWVRYEAIS